jgi:hypothetical protein
MAPRRGPICCWHHAQASSADPGASSHHVRRCGWRGPPDVVCHGFRSCRGVPAPIWCQRFDHGIEFFASMMVEGSAGPLLGLHNRSRVRRGGVPLLGIGKGAARSQGSNERNPSPRGRVDRFLPPGGRIKPRSCPLIVHSILTIGDRQFPFFRYPKIGTGQ